MRFLIPIALSTLVAQSLAAPTTTKKTTTKKTTSTKKTSSTQVTAVRATAAPTTSTPSTSTTTSKLRSGQILAATMAQLATPIPSGKYTLRNAGYPLINITPPGGQKGLSYYPSLNDSSLPPTAVTFDPRSDNTSVIRVPNGGSFYCLSAQWYTPISQDDKGVLYRALAPRLT